MAEATKPEDRISARHGGLVPLAYWQKSFNIDIEPDPAAPYVVKRGSKIYIDTKHREYTRWLVGFVKGAANAVDQAIKRKTH